MRCMLGLDRPERGATDVRRQAVPSELHTPLHEVGALLDAGYVHPGRTRPQPPAVAGRVERHRRRARRRGARDWSGMTDGRQPQGQGRTRSACANASGWRACCSATRTRHPRRAGQRARPGRHPLDPRRPRRTSRAGQDRARQQPPAVGDGADGRRPRRDRPGRLIEQWSVERLRRPPRASAGCACAAAAGRRSPSVLRRAAARSSRPHGQDGIDVHGLPIERIGELAAADADVVLHELSPQTESLEDAFLRRPPARRSTDPEVSSHRPLRATGRPAIRRAADDRRTPQRVDQAPHGHRELGAGHHRRRCSRGRDAARRRLRRATPDRRRAMSPTSSVGIAGRVGAAARRRGQRSA